MKVIGATNRARVFESHARLKFVEVTGEIAPKDIGEIVDRLEKVFSAADPSKLLQCDKCHGWSTDDLDACPYCGEAEVVTRDAPPPELTEATPESARPDSVEAGAPAVLAIAPVALVSSEDILDSKLAELSAFLQSSQRDYSRACAIVAELHDLHWMQRTEDGRPKYKTFDQFVRDELGMTKQRAYEMLRVHRVGLAGLAPIIGVSATKMIAAAPAEQQHELIEQAKAGASAREIKAAIGPKREPRETPPSPPTTNEVRARTGLPPIPPSPRRPDEPHAHTLVMRGKSEVPVYEGKPGDEEPMQVSPRASHPWWFELETDNGFTILVQFKRDRHKQVRAVVTVTKHADDDDDAQQP